MQSPRRLNPSPTITASTFRSRVRAALAAARRRLSSSRLDLEEFAGYALVVYGVSMISDIAAVILAGVILVARANIAALTGGPP